MLRVGLVAAAAAVAGFIAGRRRRGGASGASGSGGGGGGEGGGVSPSVAQTGDGSGGGGTVAPSPAGSVGVVRPDPRAALRRREQRLVEAVEREFVAVRSEADMRAALSGAGLDEPQIRCVIGLFFAGGSRRAAADIVRDCAGGGGHGPDVFLGGSCAVTTWRKRVATPLLRARGVSYYDPQVSEWNERLMVLENIMKHVSGWLLFVIGGETRGIVSLVEAAQYIAEGRPVILLVHGMADGAQVFGHDVTGDELRTLNNARKYLLSVAELYGTPVHETVEGACEAIADMKETRDLASSRQLD